MKKRLLGISVCIFSPAIIAAWVLYVNAQEPTPINMLLDVNAQEPTPYPPTPVNMLPGDVLYCEGTTDDISYYNSYDSMITIHLVNGELRVKRVYPSSQYYAIEGPNNEAPGMAYLDIYRAVNGEVVLATTIVGIYVPQRIEPAHVVFPGMEDE